MYYKECKGNLSRDNAIVCQCRIKDRSQIGHVLQAEKRVMKETYGFWPDFDYTTVDADDPAQALVASSKVNLDNC